MAKTSSVRRDSLNITQLAKLAYGTPSDVPSFQAAGAGDDSVTIVSQQDLKKLEDAAAAIRSRIVRR